MSISETIFKLTEAMSMTNEFRQWPGINGFQIFSRGVQYHMFNETPMV